MWPRFINAALGIWLMAAPSVLGYVGTGAEINERICGPILITFSIVAIWETTRPLRWVCAATGAWLLVSPWIFGFDATIIINEMLVGAVALTMGLIKGEISQKFGGGWSDLWPPHRRRAEERAA
jgi:hypothetical protein